MSAGSAVATKKFPLHPAHPERNCWGCDRYCPADSLQCGNGSERTQHPAELFGDDWAQWGLDKAEPVSDFGPEPSESSSIPKRL
ncbi:MULTISPECIES: DUF3079 domain-containing protein [unclassified Acidovorax]|uniref:DUF3079 domain-containing protein n=1 Tax=unclassified Acidovorax TaxID=2684926 RepID=UPI002883303A|nr:MULTISPECIES: DUF3079 domain-containing protein [unclassified Acidovorax]